MINVELQKPMPERLILQSEITKLQQQNKELQGIIQKQKDEFNEILYPTLDKKINDLKVKLDKAVEALKLYADCYIFDEADDDTEQLDLNKPWRHYGGKLARQTLKEIGEA